MRVLIVSLMLSVMSSFGWTADDLIAPVKATASSSQAKGADVLIGEAGLSKEADAWVHSNNRWESGGTMWNANYNYPKQGVNDNHPVVILDLGESKEIGAIVIWNYNEKDYTFKGVKDFELKSSADGKAYEDVGTFQLKEASGKNGEPAQSLTFKAPVTARYFQLTVVSKQGGDADGMPGLSKVRFVMPGAKVASPAAAGG